MNMLEAIGGRERPLAIFAKIAEVHALVLGGHYDGTRRLEHLNGLLDAHDAQDAAMLAVVEAAADVMGFIDSPERHETAGWTGAMYAREADERMRVWGALRDTMAPLLKEQGAE